MSDLDIDRQERGEASTWDRSQERRAMAMAGMGCDQINATILEECGPQGLCRWPIRRDQLHLRLYGTYRPIVHTLNPAPISWQVTTLDGR